ncbi:4-galactosyl-N-acetylglucosaminide 3-alpha-L-fucosyltransferase 9-like [Cololabis saira]|uniref:4-galactosyl-N-acetylglucosaminide 3-alpha-L-fucosyltransferase 9-like n=1 Tax=Cololabis saira TaxID=129043 RepID=UPI002AD5B0E7|nr:4-galactosyl-N-acetylglucosaminide 3-alpha-L-fucosyltransferase 9-like [Cololabis saira]
MSSTSFDKILRPILAAIFFLGFSFTAFFMYFKPTTSWLYDIVESTTSTVEENKPFFTKSATNVTIVLLWFWPFGQIFDLNVCSSLYKIEGCFLTADRNFYNQSDGVVMHHREISSDLSNLPHLQRPHFQKWIWMNMESPSHSSMIPGMDNLFNLTLNYRRDADIEVPYGSLIARETEENFVPPTKDKVVCWIVSNWDVSHLRSKYYFQLQRHIAVRVYGNAFNKHLPDEDYVSTLASCKFYLAFENSIHKDYMTEKLYNPLSVGTVPVVLGPPRKNYENFLPGGAFIHIDDFSSAKELAEYLLLLDKNNEMYLRYFKWQRYFKVKSVYFWAEHTCKACDYLKRQKAYQAFNNLNRWYWG